MTADEGQPVNARSLYVGCKLHARERHPRLRIQQRDLTPDPTILPPIKPMGH
ncbi:MAG: hypothetical protein M3540_00470 [Actinomycetota bacterium]|nr:hypothetical protein [Actinomycetota bacterium]